MNNSIDGCFIATNEMHGQPMRLTFKELKKGVVRNKGVFICSADFTDPEGEPCTVDFMVAKRDGVLYVMTALLYFYNHNAEKMFGKGTIVLKVA